MTISFQLTEDENQKVEHIVTARRLRRRDAPAWLVGVYWYFVLPAIVVAFALASGNLPLVAGCFLTFAAANYGYSLLYRHLERKIQAQAEDGKLRTWTVVFSDQSLNFRSGHYHHSYAWAAFSSFDFTPEYLFVRCTEGSDGLPPI